MNLERLNMYIMMKHHMCLMINAGDWKDGKFIRHIEVLLQMAQMIIGKQD